MKKYFILAAAALTLAACSNDESNNTVNDNVIRLSSSVGTVTRAASDIYPSGGHFENGTAVKVQVIDKKTTDADAVTYTAINYTDNGSGTLTGVSTQYYPASGSAVKVYAYYPATASTASEGFAVSTNQNDDDAYKASDLMYASLDPLTKGSTNALTFNHLLSKIVVTLAAGDGFDDTELASASVVLKSVKYKGTFNPAGGTFEAADATTNITITEAAGTTAKAAVVVPQDMSDKTLEVTIAGKTISYTFPSSSNFAPKTHNDYTITVAKTGISVSSTLGDWGTGTSNTDTLTF